jgi:hypothetical protein
MSRTGTSGEIPPSPASVSGQKRMSISQPMRATVMVSSWSIMTSFM